MSKENVFAILLREILWKAACWSWGSGSGRDFLMVCFGMGGVRTSVAATSQWNVIVQLTRSSINPQQCGSTV